MKTLFSIVATGVVGTIVLLGCNQNSSCYIGLSESEISMKYATAPLDKSVGITIVRGCGYTGSGTLTLEGVPNSFYEGITRPLFTYNFTPNSTTGNTSTLVISNFAPSSNLTRVALKVVATGSGGERITSNLFIDVGAAPYPCKLVFAKNPMSLVLANTDSTLVTVDRSICAHNGLVSLELANIPTGPVGNIFNANLSSNSISGSGSVTLNVSRGVGLAPAPALYGANVVAAYVPSGNSGIQKSINGFGVNMPGVQPSR